MATINETDRLLFLYTEPGNMMAFERPANCQSLFSPMLYAYMEIDLILSEIKFSYGYLKKLRGQ